MATPRRPRATLQTRPPVKRAELVEALRRQIITGTLPPGAQLPTRIDLARQFGVSSVTVQRALDELVEAGFVRVQASRGTFVADHPPHAHRYGIVFSTRPEGAEWFRFFQQVVRMADGLSRRGQRTFRFYYGIDGRPDGEDFQQLRRDLRARALAGVIFVNPVSDLVLNEQLEQTPVPALAVMNRGSLPGVDCVTTDHASFFDRAVSYLQGQGRHRIAVIMATGSVDPPTQGRDWLSPVLRRHGVAVPPKWLQSVSPRAVGWTSHLVQLLFAGEQSRRPDGLILTDDNLASAAASGLLAAGVQVPEDVAVVSHCNFPEPESADLPFVRIGFHIGQLLERALAVLDRPERGGAPVLQQVTALTEPEAAAVDQELAVHVGADAS